MFKYFISVVAAIICMALSSCGNGKSTTDTEADSCSTHYAKYLQISEENGYTVATVLNPWEEGKILQRYVIVSENDKNPNPLPKGTVLNVPLKNTVVYSSVHTGIIKELTGNLDYVRGICDLQYFDDDSIVKRVERGRIANCGASMSPSVETLINIDPDAILLSPYHNAGFGVIATTGIPIVECADYMETNPLGRAEWIKFFGLIFGQTERADSIFNTVEANYNNLKSMASSTTSKPKVIVEKIYNGTWYVPGGKSYMSTIISDAGGDYPWKDNDEVGALQLDFERVFSKASDADIWLLKTMEDWDYAQLKSDNKLHSEMLPFKKQNIWSCNTITTGFHSTVPYHPDKLLADFVKIFHPELSEDKETTYYKPMKK